jgi:hypothetical protein
VKLHKHEVDTATTNINNGLCATAPELTLITPWGRNISGYTAIITRSIQWQCVYQWIIVYDLHSQPVATPQFGNNSKVLEIFHNAPASRYGNLQRQEALRHVSSGMVYFLDDENAMHEGFWKWFASIATLGHLHI